MEKKFLRLMIAVIALWAALGTVAHADEQVLPAGTAIHLPDGTAIEIAETHFLVERASLDRANATAEMNRELRASLVECSSSLEALQQQKPKQTSRWVSALKWLGVGAAVGGAFALGASL